MKKSILNILSNIAFWTAVISLSQCSLAGGHQPELTDSLKKQMEQLKGKTCAEL